MSNAAPSSPVSGPAHAFASYKDWALKGHLSPYVRQSVFHDDVLGLVETCQPAGDMSDPAIPDLLLFQTLSDDISARADLGGGIFSATIPRGRFGLIPPEFASTIHCANSHAIRIFSVPAVLARQQLEDVRRDGSLDFGWLHAGIFDDPPLRRLADRLAMIAAQQTPVARLYAEGAVLTILAELSRLADRGDVPTRGGLAGWAERRCLEYLHARFAEEVSLADLAQIANLSSFHFARMFKTTTGLPPHAYQRRLRAERACELLRTSALSVGDVAVAVGYETPQAFARMFRAEIGTSPSAWRREVQ